MEYSARPLVMLAHPGAEWLDHIPPHSFQFAIKRRLTCGSFG